MRELFVSVRGIRRIWWIGLIGLALCGCSGVRLALPKVEIDETPTGPVVWPQEYQQGSTGDNRGSRESGREKAQRTQEK